MPVDNSVMTSSFVVAGAVLGALWLRRKSRGSHLPLPPGPPGNFLIGHTDLPRFDDLDTYKSWVDKYGSVIHVNLFGSHFIILNSYQAAKALLDDRSSNYSARPVDHISEHAGGDWYITSMSGEPHRIRRGIVHRYFSGSATKKLYPSQEQEAHLLLRDLLQDSNGLFNHLSRHAASVVMLSTYGIRISHSQDPVLKKLQLALEESNRGRGFIGLLVNLFPLLAWYPKWLPFSGFRYRWELSKNLTVSAFREEPWSEAKRMITQGNAVPSFVNDRLEELASKGLDEQTRVSNEEVIKDCAGVMYGAGADSTSASMATFFMVAMLFPEFLPIAQEEIDRVIGHDRLPTFGDKGFLPFIDCVCLEILRWNAVTPLGIPHSVVKDDEYEGYFIPSGSTIAVNEYLIFRDPLVFPDPDKFDPKRYLGTDDEAQKAREVVNIVFGFGRRVCPGRQLAEGTLFITVASIVACFDIALPRDGNGEETKILPRFTPGIVRRPLHFNCQITPRSEKAIELINLVCSSY